MKPYYLRWTLAEVEDAEVQGRISERDARRYWLAWLWGAARFGGDAEMRQDSYFMLHGYDALCKRRERVRAAVARVLAKAGVA